MQARNPCTPNNANEIVVIGLLSYVKAFSNVFCITDCKEPPISPTLKQNAKFVVKNEDAPPMIAPAIVPCKRSFGCKFPREISETPKLPIKPADEDKIMHNVGEYSK